MGDVTLIVLYIELKKDMWIFPLNSGNRPFNRGHLIVVSGTTMMRRSHNGKREQHDHRQRQSYRSQRSCHSYLLNFDLEGEWVYLILVRSRRQVSSPSPVRVSPNHFQCKLNLTSRCLCGCDQSCAWDGVACLVEDGEVIGR